MKVYITISIDTEPDCSANWRYSDPLSFDGVKIGIVEILQPLFIKYNICPTYLLNNVVMENTESVKFLKNLEGKHELGTHLHSEFIEPFKEHTNYAGVMPNGNQCTYSEMVEGQKLTNLTNLFKANFDRSPTSFRAGRFNARANTIKHLVNLGYKIDSSVTPYINWDNNSYSFPVDYRKSKNQPYFIKENSFLEEATYSKIVEVPVTITEKFGFIKKKQIWLRPGMSNLDQMIQTAEYYIKANKRKNFVVLNMMFHNVEVLPNLSPYTKAIEDCNRYLSDLEGFLIFVSKNKIESLCLTDIYKLLS